MGRPLPPQQPPAAPAPAFDDIRQRADAARTAQRFDEAIELYGRALRLRPSWTEGYWSVGTMYYELERNAECRDAFATVVRQQSSNADAWAFKGLCEFRLKRYRIALDDLTRARERGLRESQLIPIVRYHRAILLTRFADYERALQAFGEFAREGNGDPLVIEGMGLAVLQLPHLPQEVPADAREMVTLAGRASVLAASNMIEPASAAFQELVRRYPQTRNVHYLYGVFLLRDNADRALDEFNAELRISPDHARAMLQIAQELMKRGELETAASWATKAVAIAPRSFMGRHVLGQIKLERNDVAGAIADLEAAVRLEPSSPSAHYALAKAYRRAGRTKDAERERAEFTRLERLRQGQRGGQ
jgi:tetratricopeptide (TPR) repeat protein